MKLSALWGKITGKDKKLNFPNQQASALGRIGDFNIIHPYGIFCDLPDNAYIHSIAPNVFITATVKRPSDSARGETVVFHPETNSRIIFRNNGDIDITAPNVNYSGNVNIAGNLNVDGHTTLNTLEVSGLGEFNGGIESNGTSIDDTHAHSGVSTGPSNTGGVV